MTSPQFVTEAKAADYLGLAPATLSRWRWAVKGPAYRKFGTAVRYSITDLEDFAAIKAVRP